MTMEVLVLVDFEDDFFVVFLMVIVEVDPVNLTVYVTVEVLGGLTVVVVVTVTTTCGI